MPDHEGSSHNGKTGTAPLTIEQLRAAINELAQPLDTKDSTRGRFAALHNRLRTQEWHFYNQKQADQKLPPPDDAVEPYQTDILRKVFVELKARLVENDFRIAVLSPDDSKGALRKEANQRESVLNRGMTLLQDREDVSLLADLADGQIKDCYGVLHWVKAGDLWPGLPGKQRLTELPTDKGEAARFSKNTDDDGEFEETDDSLQERHRQRKAKAGYPWWAEVIRATNFAFTRDRSTLNGMREALVLNAVPLLDYAEKLKSDHGIKTVYRRINQHASRIAFMPEGDSPSRDDPSRLNTEAWRSTVFVASYWTRTHFFELAATTDQGGANRGNWQLVTWGTHPYGMPPFALARAMWTNHPDPMHAYASALHGLYRLKPFVDHDVTLGRAIARKIALPFYWIKTTEGNYAMEDDGKTRIILSHETAAAYAFNAGETLEMVKFELNEAFLGFMEIAREELKDAAPDIGNIEVSASTQPWTLRQAIEFANVLVKQLKNEAARALRIMVENMAMVNALPASEGGFGEPIAVYARGNDQKLVLQEAFGVDDDDEAPFEIEVTIDPNSSAQTIANIEHMRSLLNEGRITEEEFVETGLRKEDPDAYIAKLRAEKFYKTEVYPGLLRQEAARRYGTQFVLSSDLAAVGVDGAPVSPENVLAANGVASTALPADMEGDATPMGDLQTLRVPGAAPVPGGAG